MDEQIRAVELENAELRTRLTRAEIRSTQNYTSISGLCDTLVKDSEDVVKVIQLVRAQEQKIGLLLVFKSEVEAAT